MAGGVGVVRILHHADDFEGGAVLRQIEAEMSAERLLAGLEESLHELSSTTATFWVEAVSCSVMLRPRRMCWPMVSR